MIPVGAAFAEAQAARTKMAKKKLVAVLRNVASSSEGALASAPSVYSADYPASGANDDDATHLNYGPASGAENGRGRSGWRSANGGVGNLWDTKAEWNAGTQSNVITVGNRVMLKPASQLVLEDFDGYTDGALLAGQGGWLQGTKTGTAQIVVRSGAQVSGGGTGKGVSCEIATGIAGQDNVYHPFTPSAGIVEVSWWQRIVNVGQTADNGWLGLRTATAHIFVIGFDAVRVKWNWAPPVTYDTFRMQELDYGWHFMRIFMNRTVPAATALLVFRDGLQIWSGGIDTTGLNGVTLHVENNVPTPSPVPNWYIDELRVGEPELASQGSQDVVLDVGTTPTGKRAVVSMTSQALTTHNLYDGYPDWVRDGFEDLRQTAAKTVIGQVSRPGNLPITSLGFTVNQVGTVAGNIWAEIIKVPAGGTPNDAYVVARSKSYWAGNIPVGNTPMEFEFPRPYHGDGTSLYGVQLAGDYPISAANYIGAASDTIGGATYPYGDRYEFNGAATWVVYPGEDMCFRTNCNLQEMTGLSGTPDAYLHLNDGTDKWVRQTFKVPYDATMRHFRLRVKRHQAGWTPAATDEWWLEIRDSEGTLLGRSYRVGVLATWDDTTPRWFMMSLPQDVTFRAGETYSFTAMSNYAAHATNHLDIGYLSTGGYSDGALYKSTAAAPDTFTEVTGADALFSVFDVATASVGLQIAYSDDGISYGAFQDVWKNEERLASLSNYVIEGEYKRYWKLRSILRKPDWTGVLTGRESPLLMSVQLNVTYTVARELLIDFLEGASAKRVISRVEGYGHPLLQGCRRFRLEGRREDSGYWYDLVRRVDIEKAEARARNALATIWTEACPGEVYARYEVLWDDFGEYTEDEEIDGQGPWRRTIGAEGDAGFYVKAPGAITDKELRYQTRDDLGISAPPYSTGFHDVVADIEWAPSPDKGYEITWYGCGPQSTTPPPGAQAYWIFGLLAGGDSTTYGSWWLQGYQHPTNGTTLMNLRVQEGTIGLGLLSQEYYWRVVVDADNKLNVYRKVNPGDAWTHLAGPYTPRTGLEAIDRILIRQYHFDSNNPPVGPRVADIRLDGFADADVLATDGDYWGVNLFEDEELTDLKLTVYDGGTSGEAIVLELRAYRIVEMTDRVTGTIVISAESDFAERRMKGKQMTFDLSNTDYFLSVLREESGYSHELGEGVKFIMWAGFEGVLEMVRQGEFYVASEWAEDPSTGIVSVVAKDRTHLLVSADVQPGLKTGYRHHEIVEYLGNLAGVPSQDMMLDESVSVVDFFAPKEVKAWAEMQKVAEAAAFAEVYIDEYDQLHFRAVGMSARDLQLNKAPGLIGGYPPGVVGRPVFYGNVLLQLISFPAGHPDVGKWGVYQYDFSTRAWTSLGAPLPVAANRRSAVIFIYENRLYALDLPDFTRFYNDLYRYEGGTSWTFVARIPDPWVTGVGGDYEASSGAFAFVDGHEIIVCNHWGGLGGLPYWGGEGLRVYDMNYLTVSRELVIPSLVVKTIFREPNTEKLILVGRSYADLFYQSIRVYTLDRWTAAAALKNEWKGNVSGSKLRYHGADLGDNSDFYVGFTNDREDDFWPGRYVHVVVPSYSYDYTPTVFRDGLGIGLTENALAYADGYVFSVATRYANYPRVQTMAYDEELNQANEGFSLTLAAQQMANFASRVASNGQKYIYGMIDNMSVFEVQVRRRLALSTAPAFILTKADLLEARLVSSGRVGAQDNIINGVIVKSKPLIQQAALEVLWTASDLPWYVFQKIEFDIEFSKPCVAATGITVLTFAGGGAGSGSVQHTGLQRAHVTIDVSSAGFITALSISRYPVLPASTRIIASLGASKYRNRMRAKYYPIDNEYLYNPLDAAIVSMRVLGRMQSIYPRMDGARAYALWNLERFDRIETWDDRLGLTGEAFYVANFEHDYTAGTTRPKLVRLRELDRGA